MKKLLFLLLLALPSLAQTPAREPFPSDYKASPCAADATAICGSFQKERMSESGATFRGFDIKQEWVNEHWDEMRQAFLPLCAKMGSCFTVKGNDWVFCVDLMGKDFLAACDRFPADSEDRRQCGMFSTIYFMGLGGQSKLHKPAQECAAAQPASGPRKLKVWIEPATYKPDFHGPLTAYAYDAETHIPVRAHLSVDGGTLKAITNGIIPTAGYPVKWRAGFKTVPNAQGHRDFVVPSITFSAPNYESVTIPIGLEIPKLTVEMSPSPAELKPGMNSITVTTIDAATNQPAEMRVMAGDRVLGKANTPLQLEWKRGQKRPEIWVTSLWGRYSDVVVAPAQ